MAESLTHQACRGQEFSAVDDLNGAVADGCRPGPAFKSGQDPRGPSQRGDDVLVGLSG